MQHRRMFSILAAVVVALSLFAVAQEPQPSDSCIAADETIYKPGVDGVKPPQLQLDKNNKGVEIRSSMSLELLVNSEGHVCNVQVISAKDQASAKKVAEYIAEHWSFRHATRQGKPVAVRFTTNFNPGM